MSSRSLELLQALLSAQAETNICEFKLNNFAPETIGKLVSAIANAARLAEQPQGYVVWGIDDKTRAIVGTAFEPQIAKIGQTPLEFWLAQRLRPSIAISFEEIFHTEGRIVLLRIPSASFMPVEFDHTAYLRIGSATPKLSDHPQRLHNLWRKLQDSDWETGTALEFISTEEILKLLDYPTYFLLTSQPLPDTRTAILEKLESDLLISQEFAGRWNILNLGAALFARDFSHFGKLARKAIRLVVYRGASRSDLVSHQEEASDGYAISLPRLLTLISSLVPKNEFIGKALRDENPMFPTIALRELIANAVLHQDMLMKGSGPLIEIFSDRIEITNPGIPLMDPERFIDLPPRSRNERLAALCRRMRLCEERGSGIDKALTAVELFQLPAPDFRAEGEAVRVTLYAHRSFGEMTSAERVRAVYQHAVLRFLTGQRLTNSSLRARFGIADQNAAQVTRLIIEAREAGGIKLADPSSPRGGYVPFWA